MLAKVTGGSLGCPHGLQTASRDAADDALVTGDSIGIGIVVANKIATPSVVDIANCIAIVALVVFNAC